VCSQNPDLRSIFDSTDATSSADVLRADLPKSRFFLGGEPLGYPQGAIALDTPNSPVLPSSLGVAVGVAVEVGDGSVSNRSEGSSSAWANLFDSGWPRGTLVTRNGAAEDFEGSGGGADAWLPGRCTG
jgi:hypothetical protein